MAEKNFSIAVIGGGIVGVTVAIALTKRKFDVKLYERATEIVEIGAGIGVSANAVRAMVVCDPRMREVFLSVATEPDKGKERIFFDYVDAYNANPDPNDKTEPYLFTVEKPPGPDGCHRGHFLDRCLELLPANVVELGKKVTAVDDLGTEGLKIQFEDGSSDAADIVVGCDGIRSTIRSFILGPENPQNEPQYTHEYAYRAIIPMDKAEAALGKEVAWRRTMHLGHDGHILTYPIAGGELLNVAAFRYDPDEWEPTSTRLSVPASTEKVLKDWSSFGSNVVEISKLLTKDPKLNCWGIFHLGDRGVDTYFKGRMVIAGDAAHASSPHLGAGAGIGIEDAAALAEVLEAARDRMGSENEPATKNRVIEAALAAYDSVRRPRGHQVIQASRDSGMIFKWQFPGAGSDPKQCHEKINERVFPIWYDDTEAMIQETKKELEARL